MRLVGLRTYKNILRPTQNPTLAGMDTLVRNLRVPFYSNNLCSNIKKTENSNNNNSREGVYTRSCIYHALLMVFVIHYMSFPCTIVHSHALLCVSGRSCVFLWVLYASEFSSFENYSWITFDPVRLLWPWIWFFCRFAIPMHSQCFSLELTLVGRWL